MDAHLERHGGTARGSLQGRVTSANKATQDAQLAVFGVDSLSPSCTRFGFPPSPAVVTVKPAHGSHGRREAPTRNRRVSFRGKKWPGPKHSSAF